VAERAVRKVVGPVAPLPVTVKLRAGWDEEHRQRAGDRQGLRSRAERSPSASTPGRARRCTRAPELALIAATKRGGADRRVGLGRSVQRPRRAAHARGDRRRRARSPGAHAAIPGFFRELLALERGEGRRR